MCQIVNQLYISLRSANLRFFEVGIINLLEETCFASSGIIATKSN